ncbi:hypothetical protein BDZ97DRAFT_1924552 [Flammula alnicola]|nr:hypothetical protein BDZ97DRAFT_1924552 [Flammula alnicola]
MTRTARAAYPRAIIKDRSESRSGLDSSMRKSGAGQHNWGSIADERQLENAALEDVSLDEEESGEPHAATEDLAASSSSTRSVSPSHKSEISSSPSAGLSQEELEKARQFRKNAFKKTAEIDLSAIARTSAAVGSPPADASFVRRPGQDNKQTIPSPV